MPFDKQLIIFDLDGTLIDSVPDLTLAIDAMLRDLGLPSGGEANVREWVGNGAGKLVERALIAAGVSLNAHKQALELFLQHYEANCAVSTVLYPGVAEALAWFSEKKITMAVATNKPDRFIAPILQSLAIDHHFRAVVGGDGVKNKKPDPEQLNWCMTQLGFKAADTLMVGDSRNDIEAAHNAGVDVVAVSYGYNHGRPVSEERVDRVIANLCELIDT